MKFLFATLAFVATAAIGVPTPASPARADASGPQALQSLPAPTGQWRVGRVAYHWIDASRRETMAEAPGEQPREILANLWYPAAAHGGSRAPYIDVDQTDSAFEQSNIYKTIGLNRLANVQSHSFANVSVAQTRRRLPVILFSHGLGMLSPLYSAFIEDLASHGYVVVGVESAYFSAPFRLSNGRLTANRSRRPPTRADATPAEREELRKIREAEAIVQAQDLVFANGELQRLDSAPSGAFSRRLDLNRIGVFGHSRGGFAAPHACYLDARFRACLNLDGYRLTEAVMEHGLRQPYMHIQEIAPWLPPPSDAELAAAGLTRAQADAQARASAQEFMDTFCRMRGGAYVVTIAGGAHMSFSDAPWLAPEHYSPISINAGRALRLTRDYVRAFFDHHLRGENEPLLTTSPPYPEVTLDHFGPDGMQSLKPKQAVRTRECR